MINVDDPDISVALFSRAVQLAQLDDRRLEHELKQMQENAAAAFIASGESDLEAFFAAEGLVTKLRGLVARQRDRGRR